MATKAQPVRIGPFSGGLNTYSDPSAVGDEDAVNLVNFDVDLDGSLISRPPFQTLEPRFAGSAGLRLLGFYTTAAGVNWLIFSRESNAVTLGTSPATLAYDIVAGTVVTIRTYAATAMVQFQNKAWLIAPPGEALNSGSWDGTTWTNVATMPRGTSAVVYKERIFIASGRKDATNPSRIYFSGPSNPSSWTGTDFFDVNNGDGQPIVKIHSFNSSIVVFKTHSTYVFAYESSPTKGQVQSVSANIGIDGRDCLAEAENVLYVMHGYDLYSISNWNWEQLNVKVPFEYANAYTGVTRDNYSVWAVENRIICRYFDTYYVFGTKTRTWVKWVSSKTPDGFLKSPIMDNVTNSAIYYTGNYIDANNSFAPTYLFTFRSEHNATSSETYTCAVDSKVYSFNVPYSYKRLMWWGVDMLTKTKVTARVSPIVFATPVYIKTIKDQPLSNFLERPIGRLLDIDLDVTDSADIKNPSGVRMFVKYIKSMRFRQVQFKLSSQVDGTTKTGPLRIYSLTAYVANKETVNKKIN